MQSKAEGGNKIKSGLFVLFLMGEVTAYLYADGNDPVEKENSDVGEEGNI